MSIQNEIDQAIRNKRIYFIGEKLPSDWYEAFRLWLPLAEAGDPKAQLNIGRAYYLGNGIEEDNNKAIEWFEKAAAQGEPRSAYNLYKAFLEIKNPDKASEWLKKSFALGDIRAIQDVAEEKLSAGDRDGAEALFKKLLEQGDKEAKLWLMACAINTSCRTEMKEISVGVVSSAIFKAENNSPYAGEVTLLLEQYPLDDLSTVMSDWRSNPRMKVDMHVMLGNTQKEVELAMFKDAEKPSQLYLVGYSIYSVDSGKRIAVMIKEKRLLWKSKGIDFTADINRKHLLWKPSETDFIAQINKKQSSLKKTFWLILFLPAILFTIFSSTFNLKLPVSSMEVFFLSCILAVIYVKLNKISESDFAKLSSKLNSKSDDTVR